MQYVFAPQFVVLYLFAACALYVHFRGRERLRIGRQIGDHSTLMAPYNVLMYMFSGVPNQTPGPAGEIPRTQGPARQLADHPR